MTAPKVGDRVRVVLEGVFVPRQVYGGNEVFTLRLDGGGEYAYRFDILAVPVEVLPPPEPEWKPGDVVRDDAGRVWQYGLDDGHGSCWVTFGDRTHRGPGVIPRPLTRLVPEGQS